MDKGYKSPILFIIGGLLTVIFAFNNCGLGFESNSSSSDAVSTLGFNKLGNYLVTTHYDSNGVAQLRHVPYTVDGSRVLLYGETDIGSTSDIKNGDFIETPQLASDSRISQINLRRSQLSSNVKQAVNKGGYLSSIRRDSNGKRIFYYYWRRGPRTVGAKRLTPVSSDLRAKMQAEIDKLNEELSSNNINLEFRHSSTNNHSSTIKVMILSELSSELHAAYWSYHDDKKSNPETSLRGSSSQAFIGHMLRRRFMGELGFVAPLFTSKRDEVYNIKQHNLNADGKNSLLNTIDVGSDAQFFSADTVLSTHSCWKNVRSDCRVSSTDKGNLSFTLKNGDERVRYKSTFTNSDLSSMKSIYGVLNSDGEAVDVITKLVAIHVDRYGKLNAIGYACKPFSNDSVDILIERKYSGYSKVSTNKFTADRTFIPTEDLPDECTDASGNKRRNVSFHVTGTVSELGLSTSSRADDYGYFSVYVDKESTGAGSHTKLEGNHFHNDSAQPSRFRNGIYNNTNSNTVVLSYVWTISGQAKYNRCRFRTESYNNTPSSPPFFNFYPSGLMRPENYTGDCKPYVLEKLFGMSRTGISVIDDGPEDNDNSNGETITELTSDHYNTYFAIFSSNSPGYTGTVYKYVRENEACVLSPNNYNHSQTKKLTAESYAILHERYFKDAESCGGSVPPTDPIPGDCIDTAPVGDGWGWNGVESCAVQTEPEPEPEPEAGTCVDTAPLGNGWGWNGTESCRVPAVDPDPEPSNPDPGACVDTAPIGDGWGWNGTASCRITSEPDPSSKPVCDVNDGAGNPGTGGSGKFYNSRGEECTPVGGAPVTPVPVPNDAEVGDLIFESVKKTSSTSLYVKWRIPNTPAGSIVNQVKIVVKNQDDTTTDNKVVAASSGSTTVVLPSDAKSITLYPVYSYGQNNKIGSLSGVYVPMEVDESINGNGQPGPFFFAPPNTREVYPTPQYLENNKCEGLYAGKSITYRGQLTKVESVNGNWVKFVKRADGKDGVNCKSEDSSGDLKTGRNGLTCGGDSGRVCCEAIDDSDADGWGFENDKSCIFLSSGDTGGSGSDVVVYAEKDRNNCDELRSVTHVVYNGNKLEVNRAESNDYWIQFKEQASDGKYGVACK